MTNKDLINLLSGFSMKSELEVVVEKEIHQVEKVSRVYIPETKDAQGKKVAARNIVQIIVAKK
jgi:hypothetical protein